jgi:subtilisin family serine protease
MIQTLMNRFRRGFHALPFLIVLIFPGSGFLAQSADSYREVQAGMDLQWQHADASEDGLIGVSAARARRELLAGRPGQPVVVAIIDSGTETYHEDLDQALWVNEDEIAGNGIDDDGNGYADDIHGWNFIGGPVEDVVHDNLEFTRIYGALHRRFGNRKAAEIGKGEKADYKRYLSMQRDFDNRISGAEKELAEFNQLMELYSTSDQLVRQHLKRESYTLAEVQAIRTDDQMVSAAAEFMSAVLEADLVSQLDDYRSYVENQFLYSYNLDFDPRHLVGDNYADPRERYYGNNRVAGEHSEHGTHVAGIVAAEHNGLGIDGLCPSCRLMIIRCVPDGDERDKDVANAIRYAVDNGARVINMSFGKSYSPEKFVVDEAVRYAESKGVLLIHAAGNDGKNTDKKANYPSPRYDNGKKCRTWIEVGASGPISSALVADFSNYGKKTVDIFAPGVEIFSTVTGNTYKRESGTSMASPVVAGVAGALMSYYPELSASDVRAIILQSGISYKRNKVTIPGGYKVVPFGSLSSTGKVVNLHEALRLASAWKPGKK